MAAAADALERHLVAQGLLVDELFRLMLLAAPAKGAELLSGSRRCGVQPFHEGRALARMAAWAFLGDAEW